MHPAYNALLNKECNEIEESNSERDCNQMALPRITEVPSLNHILTDNKNNIFSDLQKL